MPSRTWLPNSHKVAGSRSSESRSLPPSIFGADTLVQGHLRATGDIQVDGQVHGDVSCMGLVIGESGHVLGNVVASQVTVRGRVRGNIRARDVLLCSHCHVEGDIVSRTFTVGSGAVFDGSCRREDDPLSGAGDREVPDQKSSTEALPAARTADPTSHTTPAALLEPA
jgi:cytoskeletal protein CcmA (bactofilin family)